MVSWSCGIRACPPDAVAVIAGVVALGRALQSRGPYLLGELSCVCRSFGELSGSKVFPLLGEYSCSHRSPLVSGARGLLFETACLVGIRVYTGLL